MSTLFANAATPPAIAGAGFWIRALARLIDGFFGAVLGAIGFILGSILVFLFFMIFQTDVPELDSEKGSTCLSMLLGGVGSILYHALSESFAGYSIGKYLCRLRVISTAIRPIGFEAALIRSFYFYGDAFFFGAVAYSSMSDSPLRQRIGDKRAKTIVISARDLPESIVRPANEQVMGIILGSYCWFLFQVIPWISIILLQHFSKT